MHLDQQERLALCELFEAVGPQAPTLIQGWTAHDLAAHLVLRERDAIAGPCLVLPGPFQRIAEQRRLRLARQRDFGWLIARLRSGPPAGFFRIRWIRSMASLNEFFVHHEDVRRANGFGSRDPLRPNWTVPFGETSDEVVGISAVACAVPGSSFDGREPAHG